MELLASLLNSLIFVLLSIYIRYEGFRHLFEPPEVPGLPFIVISTIGIAVNFAGMSLLSHSDAHSIPTNTIAINTNRKIYKI
jgi:cobalt-zinc-cadmium efflux system protein